MILVNLLIYVNLVSLLNLMILAIFYRTQVNLGSDSWVRLSVSTGLWLDLTDVTLADEDTYSIPTDYVKRAIQGNEAMPVM